MTAAEAVAVAAKLAEWARIARARSQSDGHDHAAYDRLVDALTVSGSTMLTVIGCMAMIERRDAT